MALKSAQLRSVQDAMDEYELKECPVWAIFEGKEFRNAYEGDNFDEGAEELKRYLTKIENAKSSAYYTLVIYKDQLQGKIISCNNLRFPNEDLQLQRHIINGYSPDIVAMRNEMEAMKQKIKDLESDDDDDDDDDDSMIGKVTTLIQNPLVLQLLGKLFNRGGDQPATMAGIDPGDQKLFQAIDILKKNDPDFCDHLYKLALISQNDKLLYTFLIAKLNSM